MNDNRKPNILQAKIINDLEKEYSYMYDELQEIQEMRDYYRLISPRYHQYQNIVNKIAILMEKLKIDDPFLTCQIFNYLLWEGYFSKDKTLIYSTDDLVCDPLYYGADVILGKSKCLNNAYLLRDVLNTLNIPSFKIGCKITGLRKISRHAITSFNYGDRIYFCDPTNNSFLSYTGLLTAREISNNQKKVSIHKGALIHNTEYVTKEDFSRFINEPFISHDTPEITKSDVMLIKKAALTKLARNLPLLEDFYDDIYSDINKVSKKLIKLKNR